MKKTIILLSVFIFLGAFCAAEEKIINFTSFIEARADGGATVTENIIINAEHKSIRRGIYRNIPKKYNFKPGLKRDLGLKVISLKRDGKTEPYFTENKGGDLVINFGNDNFINKGEHLYELQYEIKNIVGFYGDFDEIYWNVTGNGWAFPIEYAAVSLTLPANAEIMQDGVSAYAGRFGAKDCPGCQTLFDSGVKNIISFAVTSVLNPGDGLTVAVPFPKGIIAEPTAGELAQDFLKANAGIAVWLAAILLSALYFYPVWRKYGKDPAKGIIIPLYEPPKGFSPAMFSYLDKMGWHNMSDSNIITTLAVKGAVEIKKEGSSYIITKKDLDEQMKKDFMLSPEEAIYMEKLFAKSPSLNLSKDNSAVFAEAKQAARKHLKNTLGTGYFSRNLGKMIPIWILWAVALVPMFLPAFTSDTVMFTAFIVLIFIPLFAQGNAIVHLIVFIFFGVSTYTAVGLPPLIMTGVIVLINSLYVYLIKAYTPQGQAVMEQAEGFKLYLNVGEGGRLHASSPEEGANMFCNYLPYALALGVANKWIKTFNSHVASSAQAQETMNRRGMGMFITNGAFSQSSFNSMTGAVSSSATPPSSSSGGSGSGGGGSSGGGRGGGGGGGR